MNETTQKPDLSSLRISHDKKEPSGKNTSARRYILILGLVLLVVVAYFLVRNQFAAAIEVETAAASLTSPSQANAILNANGYVVAQQKASVASKGTGRLEYLGVEEGDKVKKGQIIARLEDADVRAALEKTQADLLIAKADHDDALRSLERQKTLYASGLTSKAEFDGAESRYLRVNASIKSAEAAVTGAEVGLENTRIRAPFDGTVLTKDADVGEVVAPFASSASSRGAVVTIADMSSLEVEADVSESNITRVSAGQPCEIVLDAYPEKRYAGFVHKIVPTADRAKATVLTKVRFRERDDRVLPEMSAKVSFLSKEISNEQANAQPKLTIPETALVTRDGHTVVFLLHEQAVKETPVRTGDRIGNQMEILEGLQQGDLVVVRPGSDLSTGTKVKTRN